MTFPNAETRAAIPAMGSPPLCTGPAPPAARPIPGRFGGVLWLTLLALSQAPDAAASGDYRIGSPRSEQQGNFCEDSRQIEELVDLFQRFGAPTGFSALSASTRCALRVHSFTPRSLYRQVEVSLSDGSAYTIRFIRVELSDGQSMILVTTRELRNGTSE